jgi:serine protease
MAGARRALSTTLAQLWWLSLLPLLLPATAWPAPTAAASSGLIVRLKDAPAHDGAGAADAERWRQVLREAGLSGASGRMAPQRRAVGRDQHRLDLGRPLSAEESARWVERLRQRPEVDWVQPDTRERRLSLPSDPLFTQQWWLQPAGGTDANALPERRRGVPGFVSAWQSGLPNSTAGATVAVLDTGLTPHPDLAGRTLPGHDFVADAAYANDGDGRDADASDPGDWVDTGDLARAEFDGCALTDSSWHGTLIAGLLAAATDNATRGAGIQRQARVLPVRVAGKCGAAVSDIVDGMRWAGGLDVAGAPRNPNPARVINISFGGSAACGPAYQSAIDELRSKGVVVVAAAGNEAGAPTRPASCSGVIGVAALNRDGFKATYSSFGPNLAIATVGGDDSTGRWGAQLGDGGLVSLWNDGTRGPGAPAYAGLFGTSFSTALVSGTVGLMLGLNPGLGADQIITGLRLSSRPHVTSPWIGACSSLNPGRCLCSTGSCGAGILDADQALRYAANPAAYVPPARQPAWLDSAELAAAAALGPDRVGEVSRVEDAHSGGGAAGAGWLAALALAVAALTAPPGRARTAPRPPAG